LRLLDAMSQSRAETDRSTHSAASSTCEKGGERREGVHLLAATSQGGVERAVCACEKGGERRKGVHPFAVMLHSKMEMDRCTHSTASSAREKGWEPADWKSTTHGVVLSARERRAEGTRARPLLDAIARRRRKGART
jgi:hypothetical protein